MLYNIEYFDRATCSNKKIKIEANNLEEATKKMKEFFELLKTSKKRQRSKPKSPKLF